MVPRRITYLLGPGRVEGGHTVVHPDTEGAGRGRAGEGRPRRHRPMASIRRRSHAALGLLPSYESSSGVSLYAPTDDASSSDGLSIEPSTVQHISCPIHVSLAGHVSQARSVASGRFSVQALRRRLLAWGVSIRSWLHTLPQIASGSTMD
ncbi:hypothetical protein R1flu_003092 [Riccia fluitans]|uniref:Uncharacterized protein n=1 Tax=Riccia fluitans TaxID=41844 RepID=A0ABD1Y801_9MARC